jgi:uncharacterized delta-60 repeat protein
MPNTTFFARLAAGLLALLPVGLQAQQLDPTFHPPHFALPTGQGAPSVEKVLRQTDGRYLVRGNFQSVDGHVTAKLARLLPTGYVDTTFTYRPAPLVHYWNALRMVAAQPSGKVLVNGETAAGEATIIRLLPSGQVDSTFRLRWPTGATGRPFFSYLLMQPDGKLLLSGGMADSTGYAVQNELVRLLPDGQTDTSFFPAVLPNIDISAILREPNGRILYATGDFFAGSPGSQMGRLLATGRADSSFTYVQNPYVHINSLALCPDGNYAVGGALGPANVRRSVGRLLTTGTWDTVFPFSLPAGGLPYIPEIIPAWIRAIAVQANGQILAGGAMLSATYDRTPLVRAQLQGGVDPSFDPSIITTTRRYGTYVENIAVVNDLLIEPSGKLLAAGQFEQAGSVPHWGLARLLPAAPLATNSARNTLPLEVWPVPAHGELHVQLPAAQAAQQIELLDATGRRVLTQPVRTAALTLNTTALSAGLYVLRIRYADGSAATRRVVLE